MADISDRHNRENNLEWDSSQSQRTGPNLNCGRVIRSYDSPPGSRLIRSSNYPCRHSQKEKGKNCNKLKKPSVFWWWEKWPKIQVMGIEERIQGDLYRQALCKYWKLSMLLLIFNPEKYLLEIPIKHGGIYGYFKKLTGDNRLLAFIAVACRI